MLSVDRQNDIVQRLFKDKSVSVASLSSEYRVSAETIRRDLDKLCSKDPMIIRVHGGAYRVTPDGDPPYSFRESSRVEEKTRIAEACFHRIREGDFVFMDSSTTTLYLSKLIAASDLHLTVITNGLGIINELSKCKNIDILGVGGKYTDATHSFVGNTAFSGLSGLYAAKAFVSCSGIDLDFGITHNSDDEAAIRKIMLTNSKERYLLIDSNKFGRCKTYKIVGFETIDEIFTDNELPEEWHALLRKNSIRLTICR